MSHKPERLDELLASVRAGKEAAYRCFLTEAAARLRRFIERRIGPNAEVEDIVQQCLIAIHDKRDTLDPGRPVAPWMYAIARYKVADWLRHRGRRSETVDLEQATVPPASEAPNDVRVLLGRLPAAQAEAIQLTRIDGLTAQEASVRTGVGISAIKVRVHRGMARLRAMVDESSA